jgi:hypothetical protein
MTIATAKAQISALLRDLNAAQGKARGYQDPNLSAEGLAAKSAELDAAARKDAAPRLEALRAEVAADVAAATTKGAAALPKFGEDAAAIARSQRAWDKARMRLDAGMSLRAVLANASIEEALAIKEWGPAWTEAQTYKAGAGRSGIPSAPDHAPLLRSVDTYLAELAGPDVVKALTAAHDAAGVGAYVNTYADYLGDVVADRRTSQNLIGVTVAAEHAEQLAHAGLPEQAPTGDTAPAAEGGAAE